MAVDRILVILVKMIGLFFRTIPFSWGMRIASAMGTFLFWMDPKRKYVGFANMSQALGDSFDVEKRLYYLKRFYQNLAISFIEVLRFPELTAAEVAERIDFQGIEYMKPFIGPEREKTFIALTAHYGNWELMNQALALCGVALNAMVRNQKMTGLNELLNEYRQWHGSRVISKGMSVREVFSRLGKKEPLAMLIDQDGGKKGIFSSLFGRLASTKSGAFVISMKTKTPLIPFFIVRDSGKRDRHVIYIEKPFPIPSTRQEIPQMVNQYLRLLEKYVRKAPDQWLWLHHRWKSSPIQKIVILEDGKKGHLKQSLAIAELIARAREQRQKIEIQPLSIQFKTRFRRMAVPVLLTAPSNSLVWRWRILKWGLTENSFRPLASMRGDIVISAGASLSAVNAWLGKSWYAKNIHLMKPNFVPWKRFKKIILPRHDWNRKTAPPKNVILTKITPSLEQEGVEVQRCRGAEVPAEKRIGILLGGDNDEYQMGPEWVAQLLKGVLESSKRFLITTSRRTSKEIEDIVVGLLNDHPRCDLLEITSRSQQNGIVEKILQASEIVLVTGESMSMVSEAVSSGKPVVVVFPPARRGHVTKHFRMTKELEKEGLIKIAELNEIAEILAAPVIEDKMMQKWLNEERERLLIGLRDL